MRKRLTKAERKAVYDKYGGRCAYCGCELRFEDMQVDHIVSVYGGEYHGIPADKIDAPENYNPACRACNFYKGTGSIGAMREMIEGIPARLEKLFIFRLAMKYGLVTVNDKPVRFLCEESRRWRTYDD